MFILLKAEAREGRLRAPNVATVCSANNQKSSHGNAEAQSDRYTEHMPRPDERTWRPERNNRRSWRGGFRGHGGMGLSHSNQGFKPSSSSLGIQQPQVKTSWNLGQSASGMGSQGEYQPARRGKFGVKSYDQAQPRSYSAALQQATAQQSSQVQQGACMCVVSMPARSVSLEKAEKWDSMPRRLAKPNYSRPIFVECT